MSKLAIVPDDFSFDGKKVFFVRQNGKPTENAVYSGGEDNEGNLVFFEIADTKICRPKLDGKEKYCRVLIQRVFPCLPADDEGAEA